jgi:hypothetical protein
MQTSMNKIPMTAAGHLLLEEELSHRIRRQSQANPNIWVSLDRQPAIVTAASNSLAQFKKHGNPW